MCHRFTPCSWIGITTIQIRWFLASREKIHRYRGASPLCCIGSATIGVEPSSVGGSVGSCDGATGIVTAAYITVARENLAKHLAVSNRAGISGMKRHLIRLLIVDAFDDICAGLAWLKGIGSSGTHRSRLEWASWARPSRKQACVLSAKAKAVCYAVSHHVPQMPPGICARSRTTRPD